MNPGMRPNIHVSPYHLHGSTHVPRRPELGSYHAAKHHFRHIIIIVPAKQECLHMPTASFPNQVVNRCLHSSNHNRVPVYVARAVNLSLYRATGTLLVFHDLATVCVGQRFKGSSCRRSRGTEE